MGNLSLSLSSTIQCTNHIRIPSQSINHTLSHILILTQSQNTISLSTSLILSQSLSLCITSHTLSHHRYIIHLSQSLSLCTTSHTLSHHHHTTRLNQNHTTLHTNHILNLRHTTHLRPSTRTIPSRSQATDTPPHPPLHMHHQLLHPRHLLN